MFNVGDVVVFTEEYKRGYGWEEENWEATVTRVSEYWVEGDFIELGGKYPGVFRTDYPLDALELKNKPSIENFL